MPHIENKRENAPLSRPLKAIKPILLDRNENPYGPSPQAREAILKAQSPVSRYPTALEQQLLETLAQHHGVDPAQILLGCGSCEILRVADMAFLGPDKNLIVAEPTFEAVLTYAKVTHAETIKVPLTRDFRHDLVGMADAVSDRTGMVYVCNPNNPTGTLVTREELATLISRVPPSALVVVDEAYHHFVENSQYRSACEWIGRVPNLLVVRTFSKIYGLAGVRLGYAISTPANIQRLREHLIQNNTNVAGLEAALASLSDSGYASYQRQLNTRTRRWLCKELTSDGYLYIPSVANFVMINVEGDVQPVIDALCQQNIFVGRRFPSLPTWLRVSIGTWQEMEVFLAALRTSVPLNTGKAA